MVCEKCRRAAASWLDERDDRAICNACAHRNTSEGLHFIRLLTRADALRRARWSEEGGDGNGDEAA